MRVIIAAAGTGGHINPGIAIANKIMKEEKNSEVLFVGTSRGIEKDLVPRAGYKLETIEAYGFSKKISKDNIKKMIKTVKSVKVAENIIKKFKPDIVIGTGGYICGPVLTAANKLKIPFIVEKQFDGKEYRVLLTKEGKYAVLYREPAHVIGDGEHSILELINIENEKRKERVNCLCPIAIDEITERFMKKNNISMEDIPKKNQKVYLRHNSNVAKGGLCIDFTDKIHSSVIENCKKILDIFSGLSYVGIDYMSKDIKANQTADMYNIVEVNTVPGIHMHMRPSEGKPRNVAKYMVDMIFPETKEQRNEQL